MRVLPTTPIFATGFWVAIVVLSVPVSLRRIKVGEGVSDSAGLALKETSAASRWMVVGAGVSLAVGRLPHAVAMLRGVATLRGLDMVFTYLALLFAGGRLITGVTGGL